MHVKRRRLPNFESCSVALFASLALYGPLPSKAQTATSSPVSASSSGVAGAGAAIPSNGWTPQRLRQAFGKTDADGDKLLSREEASALPGLARRFDQIDTNKDGSISSAEFDEALKERPAPPGRVKRRALGA
jgi:hypothetical protein